VVLSAVGCAKSSAAPEPSASQALTATPATAYPQRRTLTRDIDLPGVIEGFETTTLTTRVAGKVKELFVDIQDEVREGDLLATLEANELNEEVNQKWALVKQAEAEVVLAQRVKEAADAAVTRAGANVLVAQASHERALASVIRRKADFERAERLYRTNSIEREKLDQTVDDYESAKASIAETKASIEATKAALLESTAQRDKASADIEVSRAKVVVARADHEHARANAAYLDIYAPYDGVVTKRYAERGDTLQPSSGTSMLFTIKRVDKVRVWLDVPESEAVHITTGQKVQVRVAGLDDQEIEGKVSRDTHAVDAQSRTLRVQIDLPNPKRLLRMGGYVSGRLVVAHPDVWTVPSSAVWVQDDQPMVMRIEDGVARRTPVKVGLRQGGYVQLVKKQVRVVPRGEPLPWDAWTGQEEIVVDNPAAVVDGQPLSKR
jgi:HlyD family secretion protein